MEENTERNTGHGRLVCDVSRGKNDSLSVVHLIELSSVLAEVNSSLKY